MVSQLISSITGALGETVDAAASTVGPTQIIPNPTNATSSIPNPVSIEPIFDISMIQERGI